MISPQGFLITCANMTDRDLETVIKRKRKMKHKGLLSHQTWATRSLKSICKVATGEHSQVFLQQDR